MILVRRKSDGLYIATIDGWDGPDGQPGYRHIVHTLKPDLAFRFTEEAAARICDFDFEGVPYSPKGYNAIIRESEYERIADHPKEAIRAEAGSGS